MAALAPFTTRDFLVQWSASDDAAGVTSYDVFASENGGDYVSWLQGTTNTSATFSGTAGHTYAFYARARDRVGNSRPTPSTPDTQTTVFTDGPLVLSPFLAPSGDVLDHGIREAHVEGSIWKRQLASVRPHGPHLRERGGEPAELRVPHTGDLPGPRIERLEEVVGRAAAERGELGAGSGHTRYLVFVVVMGV